MAATSAPVLRVDLLGGFRLSAGDAVLLDGAWGRRKARALLELVALQPDRAMHRDAVLEALWPDLPFRAATNNLHKNLHHLRSALTERDVRLPLLELQDDLVRLDPAVSLDVDEFRALAADARRSGDTARYDAALAGYPGDLLPEDAYEEWTLEARDGLRAIYARLLTEVAALHEAAGRLDAAVERLDVLLRLDPLDEEAHRRLMRAHALAGSRHRALRQYERCRDALRTELGVEPSEETEALHRAIAEGRVASVGPRTASRGGSPRTGAPRLDSPPGRERETAILEDALDAALDGSGQAVILSGDAGIGKSHLLDAVVARAEAAGARVLRGRAYEFGPNAAYQPLREMLRGLMDEGAEAEVRDLLDHSVYLRRLCGPATSVAVPATEPDLLRAELFDEIVHLVATLAGGRPVTLCFDDLHAADEGTLQLLHVLGRRLDRYPVLLLACQRSDEARRPVLAELRAALRRDGRLREIELAPLPHPAMARIVEGIFTPGTPDPRLVDEIVERSDGNPLFAHELAHTLIDEGRARLVDGRWQRRAGDAAAVPHAVRDLLERRLQRLGEDARDELNAAAVLGSHIDFAGLRRMTELPEPRALDALDECIAAFILEEAEDGYRFRHDLLREAVYERLTTARRRHLHRRAAAALTAEGAVERDAEEVAHHFALSDEPWHALPFILASGRRAAAVFANEQASEIYERGLELATRDAQHVAPADHAALLEDLADLRRRLAHVDDSVRLFEQAADRYRDAGDEEGVARVRGKAALGHIIRGDAGAASDHIEATLRSLTDQSPGQVVSRTYYLLAQLHWHGGQHQQALKAAEQALLAADDGEDQSQRARAYEVLALACHSLGDWRRGVEYELSRQALGVSGFDADEAFDAHL